MSVNVVNETKDGIISKSNFGDFATLKSNVKSWTNNHKEQLLKGAELAQKKGNQLALTGLGAAAIGAPIGGVGATPGLMVAATGKAINGLGSLIEIGTKVITNDDGASGEIKVFVAGKLVSKGVEMAVSVPIPGMSEQVEGMVKTVNMSIGNIVDKSTEPITDKLKNN